MVRDYHDLIMKLREEGKGFTEIADILFNSYGYKVSRQAISKYVKKVSEEGEKQSILDTMRYADVRYMYECSSSLKAYHYLISKGYDISYYRVSELRNKK